VRIVRTETKVFKFAELSGDAKQSAIDKLYDLNVDHDWWDMTYDDAETVGIKITSFDIGRGAYCEGDISDSEETAKLIIENHGEICETCLTALAYQSDRAKLVIKYSDGVQTDIVAEDNEYDFDIECDELDEEFKKSILEDYRIVLRKEYDYLTTKEAIIESIKANDYEFTEDGSMH
jgi:hypothetical protein